MSVTLLQAYLEDLRLRHCAPSTRRNAITTLPRFFDHLRRLGVRDIRKLSEAHVVSFARHLARARTRKDTPLAVSTQAQYLGVVKAFCGFLERTRRVLGHPLPGSPKASPIRASQLVPLQDSDLLPQGDVLEHQFGPRPTSYSYHSEDDCDQQEEQPEHGPRRFMESGPGCNRQPLETSRARTVPP